MRPCLAAYSMEGRSDRHLINTKQIMTQDPATLHAYLSHLVGRVQVEVCVCKHRISRRWSA